MVNSHDTSFGTANRVLLGLLCQALDARTEDQVANSLRDYQQHVTAEMLLRLSALSAYMERTIEMFGLANRLRDITIAFVGQVHTLASSALTVSEKQHVSISNAVDLLGSSTYGDGYRAEQVAYQDALSRITTTLERDDRSILKGLTFTCLNSFSLSITADEARTYSEILDAASRGPIEILRVPMSKAIPCAGLILAWIRAVWKTLVPSDRARRFLSIAFWSFVSGFALWCIAGPRSWLRTIFFVFAVGLLVLCLATTLIFRLIRLRHFMPTGSWDRRKGTITLVSGSDQASFRKSLVHELAHMLKDSGLFKRDLATLWEAYVIWRKWEIDGNSLAFFRKGVAADVPVNQMLSDLELYVRSHDEQVEEGLHEYTMGYFIFGRLVALCHEDPDLTEAFVTFIMRGESVRDAWRRICSLPRVEQAEDGPPETAARLSLWTRAHLTQSPETRDDPSSALFERGRRILALDSDSEILDSLQATYKSNSSQWGTPLVELAAVVAGYLQERQGGSAALALDDAKLLRDESCIKTLFHQPLA